MRWFEVHFAADLQLFLPEKYIVSLECGDISVPVLREVSGE